MNLISRFAIGASVALAGATSDASTLPVVAESPKSEQLYLQYDYLFVDDPMLYASVQAVIDKLLSKQPPLNPRPKLLIYSAENFMGSADIESNILVSTQTLRRLDSEDELAALVAHELVHLIKKHPTKKSFMHRFPVGVDSYAAIMAATDRLKQQQGQSASNAEVKENQKRVARSQNASLFWSDILAPSWNRKDEQEADRLGLEMMQAAGYDPGAIVTLIGKLAEGSVQRSARMQAFCDELVEQERKRRLKTGSNDELTQAAVKTVDELRDKGSEKLIREAFDELLKFSAPYSSNDERIERLKNESANGAGGRDLVATKHLTYRKADGDNGELLNLDERVIASLESLDNGEVTKARDGLKDSVSASAKSPHFRLAASAFYEAQDDKVNANAQIVEWLGTPRAPVVAFLMLGDYQSSQAEYAAALETLGAGRTRLGTSIPFLPPMITAARANKDEALAEKLTLECKDAQSGNAITKAKGWIMGDKPTGIYAECITRLGRLPAGEKEGGGSIWDRVKLP